MKDVRRSRRLRLPRRRYPLTEPLASNDDDESDLEHEILQQKSMARSNKNANRTATALFDTISTSPIEQKQHHGLPISSDPSSLFLYSINSIQKPAVSTSDLTALTRTATNTTSLTALPYSDTKETETGVVKIDLTDLSETDPLDSSPANSDHDQPISFDRNISVANIDHKMKPMKDLTQFDDTDASVKSVTFSKDNASEQERPYQQHTSCITIPNVGNGDCIAIGSPPLLPVTAHTDETTCERLSMRWNLRNTTDRMKFFIGCSSLGLIAGILILVIIL